METNREYLYRTEQHTIKPTKEIYALLDELTFKSKNLYNLALYEQRQIFFEHSTTLSYYDLYNMTKNTEVFKNLPCKIAQQTLKDVCSILKAFHKASKDFYKTPNKYKGKPKLPEYKNKTNGRYQIRFNNQACRIKEGRVYFHKVMEGFSLKTKLDNVCEVRIVPRNKHFVIEVVGYKIAEVSKLENSNIAGIDLGIDNFATITVIGKKINPLIINGKGLKSYNKFFNKNLASMQSEAILRHKRYSTNKIESSYEKRNRYFKNFMHQASKKTVDFLVANEVTCLVIGWNKGWKQESKLSKQVNQTFIQIPYKQYRDQVIYKAEEKGIKVCVVDESYTSGTSFLDHENPSKENYDKSRRVYRGLFISNTGIKINADVNASYQIIKKIFPKISEITQINGIERCGLHPLLLNIV